MASDTASLDTLITGAAEGWTAERLAPLERNILRVAVHELLDRPDIPPAVSIDEAVDLAKRYCQTEAAGFVNGILGRIVAEQTEVGPLTAPDDDRALETAAERLGEVARRLGDDDVAPEELRALAEEALALGAQITERLPRALRAATGREG